MNECMKVCMHAYLYMYVCMYVCVCVCMYVYMHIYVCVYVCMYVFMYVHDVCRYIHWLLQTYRDKKQAQASLLGIGEIVTKQVGEIVYVEKYCNAISLALKFRFLPHFKSFFHEKNV